MAKRHPRADREQPVRFRVNRRDRDPELLGRTQQQQRIANRIRRRQQQQTPRVLREPLESSHEALLDPSRETLRAHQPKATRQLRRRQPPRQLQQRQRIPPRFRHDPVTHAGVQHETNRRAEQRTGIAVVQATHLQLGDVPKLLASLTRSEHDPNGLGQQTPSHERERQRRGLIQPLRVIHDTQQGPLLSHLREQAQHPQTDEEPIRDGAGAQPEHDLKGLPLWGRQPSSRSRSDAHNCCRPA